MGTGNELIEDAVEVLIEEVKISLCMGQTSALEYAVGVLDDYQFSSSTSVDTICETEDRNGDQNENTALPPNFGTHTKARLAINLVPNARDSEQGGHTATGIVITDNYERLAKERIERELNQAAWCALCLPITLDKPIRGRYNRRNHTDWRGISSPFVWSGKSGMDRARLRNGYNHSHGRVLYRTPRRSFLSNKEVCCTFLPKEATHTVEKPDFSQAGPCHSFTG